MKLRLGAIAVVVSVLCLAAPPPAGPPALKLKPVVPGKGPTGGSYPPAQVAQGGHLVTIGGCDDCHTPKVFDPAAGMPVPDMARRLAGHPEGAPDPLSGLKVGDMLVVGPTFTSFRSGFGVAYAANLTPDLETGSGGWTEETFMTAMRTGRHLGNGRPILPPMPFSSLARATDDELRAMFAFFRSLPPVHNKVPEPKVPAPALEQLKKVNAAMLASN